MENDKKIVNILAFGMAAEMMKTDSLRAEGITDTDTLKAWLFERFPELEETELRMAVNRKIVHDNAPLADGDEVALLPPFSGG